MIPSASQTVGPFFNFALTRDLSLGILASEGADGERIRLVLRVLDGDGVPAPCDALIELWQADARGVYAHPLDPRAGEADPKFRGFGRLETALDGTCAFDTVKPGPVNGAPHINVAIFARGLLKQLYTRVYFDGDPLNPSDPVLALVPEERRATLLARKQAAGPWHMDIRLQGDGETVFFDV